MATLISILEFFSGVSGMAIGLCVFLVGSTVSVITRHIGIAVVGLLIMMSAALLAPVVTVIKEQETTSVSAQTSSDTVP